METYQEISERHQREVNELPLYWAFGSEQFRELLKKLGLTEEEAREQLCSFIGGSIVFIKDVPGIIGVLERHKKEMKEFRKKRKNLKAEMMASMADHEYGYTMDPSETLEALGISPEDLRKDRRLRRTWEEAKKEYLSGNI